MQFKWETTAAAAQDHIDVMTLPVNLPDQRRTNEELDRYLHMLHLKGYRDYVEASFQWVKGETHEPDDDGNERS